MAPRGKRLSRGKRLWGLGIAVLFVILSGFGLKEIMSGNTGGEDHLSERNPDSGFFLTLYDVPMEDLATARAAGFQMVHLYDSHQSLIEAIRYLAAAQAAGLQVMQNMPSAHLHDGDDFWIEWVSTLATYDNLACWYLPEEPRAADHAAMRRLYEIVQENDPHRHPAVVYLGTTYLERWCDVSDSMLLPAYPDFHGAPRVVARAWLDIARDACGDKTVVSVQTLFDSNFDSTGDRPTPAEARSDAYTAVIAGSQGLSWYSYLRGRALPELWPAVQDIVAEMNTLAPIITSPHISQTIEARVLSGPERSPEFEGRAYEAIQSLQKSYDGASYLLAVNVAEGSVSAEFQGLPEGSTEVRVLFEDRTVPIEDRAFVDEFSAATTHVYEIMHR